MQGLKNFYYVGRGFLGQEVDEGVEDNSFMLTLDHLTRQIVKLLPMKNNLIKLSKTLFYALFDFGLESL